MAKVKKQQALTNAFIFEVMAFLFALGYMQSVLTVAHHTSMWVHNGSKHIVESPALLALIISVVLCGYCWYKKTFTIDAHSNLADCACNSLTILAIWLAN